MKKRDKKRNTKENLHFSAIRNHLHKCKHSQVAIFVIIALIIVVSISLIYIFVSKPEIGVKAEENPQAYIEQCIEPILEEAETSILKHGGYVQVSELNKEYDGEKRAYLCYVEGEEELCINKEPMLIPNIEQEIYNDIESKIEGCFDSLEEEFVNYDYYAQPTNLEIEVRPNQLVAKIRKEITITREGSTRKVELFDTYIDSPLYDMVVIITDILNQEVSCNCPYETCNADIMQLAKQYRNFEVERFVTGDNEKLYTVKEILSEKEFVFAVRNCIFWG